MPDSFRTNFFVLRSPLLPFQITLDLYAYLKEFENTGDYLRKVFTDKIILESIYISSPSLFKDTLRYVDGEIEDQKENRKVERALYQYLIRMSTRSTPFGLFAMCSLGKIGSETKFRLNSQQEIRRHLRLDMDYLCDLSRHIEKLPGVRKQLMYTKNDSIYNFNKHLRFVEYIFTTNGRSHKLSEVERNVVLTKILKSACRKISYNDLVAIITAFGYETVEAEGYINELIDNQILKSELNPNVTGRGFSEELMDVISRLDLNDNSLKTTFQQVLEGVADFSTSPSHQSLMELEKRLHRLGIPSENRRLFQVDSIRAVTVASLDRTISEGVLSAVKACALLDHTNISDTRLEVFKRAFYERYEHATIPLVQAMDPVVGLGYKLARSSSDYFRYSSPARVEWNEKLKFKFKKINEAYACGGNVVEVTDEELIPFKRDLRLPDSFSSLISVGKENNDPTVFLKSSAGPSAANLLGRFCHADLMLNAKIGEAIHDEQSLHPEKIYAEIIHLPEDRIGNILSRPHLRQYEISYLSNSTLPVAQQICVDDLFLKIERDKFILLSKTHNKEVIPRLSTAHNYSFDSLPIYHFLCDLQSQHLECNLSWDWGALRDEEFLPRIKYRNVVLCAAQWTLRKKALEQSASGAGVSLLQAIKNYISRKRLPHLICLTEADNFIVLDLSCEFSIRHLLEVLIKNEKIVLQEFWDGATDKVVSGEDGQYVNEIILPFINCSPKASYAKSRLEQPFLKQTQERSFPPGSEWLYFKIYCSSKIEDQLIGGKLRILIRKLIKMKVIDKWFFIRYNDPHNHLRFRVHLLDVKMYGTVVSMVYEHLEQELKSQSIGKLQIDTYNRELERYNDIILAESFFFTNSNFVCAIVSKCLPPIQRKLAAAHWIDNFLTLLFDDLPARVRFIKYCVEGFTSEFALKDKKKREHLNLEYREIQNQLRNLLSNRPNNEDLNFIIFNYTTYEKELMSYVNQIDVSQDHTYRLLASYIHMFINRLMQDEPLRAEMTVYYFLDRYYLSELALAKQNLR